MKTWIVIPARYASTRLPGKPLADIAGKPMIVRVLERMAGLRCDGVVAAVDDARVHDAVVEAGFEAVMTRADHASGSDRVMEVAATLALADQDVVVNVQGDEPLIPPANVAALIELMGTEPDTLMATLSAGASAEEFTNPNAVKVVCDDAGNALYFSRAPIPYPRDAGLPASAADAPAPVGVRRHVGVYAFRVGALREFTLLPVADLERIEQLEQLRWLQAGGRIRVIAAPEVSPGGVDTEADRVRVAQALS